MVKIEGIMSAVKNEQARSDKMFTGLEFNIREEQVVMNYIYADYNSADADADTYIPHGEDPVFMNEEEMNLLLLKLQEKNIDYNIRKDEFI